MRYARDAVIIASTKNRDELKNSYKQLNPQRFNSANFKMKGSN